ncbi:MAG: hemerythrin family protein [Thiobacillus sp.]|nr:hemerythrin family protein [Thiobacillus sp.]
MTGHAPIEWNESFDTGVAEIDEQHRILVNTLNEANAKLLENVSLDFVEQITQDLLSYALYHFETEEELMQECGYSDDSAADAELHLQQHRSFSSKVVTVRDNLRAGIPISREDLIGFLNDWLVNHILNTDKRLGAYIVAKRSGTA